MNGSNGTILGSEDTSRRSKELPPLEVEVDEEQRKVRGMRKALRDTGTVKVRNAEGRALFYCLSLAEYRRLKSEAGE